MKINEVQGKPVKAQMPDGTVKDVRLIFQTYKIEKDKDTENLIEVFAEGVEIVLGMQVKDATYVIVKKVQPIKLALSA